jgi:hypothetical protein
MRARNKSKTPDELPPSPLPLRERLMTTERGKELMALRDNSPKPGSSGDASG